MCERARPDTGNQSHAALGRPVSVGEDLRDAVLPRGNGFLSLMRAATARLPTTEGWRSEADGGGVFPQRE